MHYVLMYVTSKVLCIMVNFWPDLQFINNETVILSMSRLFKSAGDPTSQLSDSLESSTLQDGSGCSGVVLLRHHSCTPLLHLEAQVRLAASAFPPPPLARDAVWGSVHRCCCSEPAIPAHTQTLIHNPGPCTYTNAKGSYESVRKNGRSCSLFCHT